MNTGEAAGFMIYFDCRANRTYWWIGCKMWKKRKSEVSEVHQKSTRQLLKPLQKVGEYLGAQLGTMMWIRSRWYNQRVVTSEENTQWFMMSEQRSILPFWLHESLCDSFLLPHEVNFSLVLGQGVSSSKNRCQVRWNRERAVRRKIKNLERFIHNLMIGKVHRDWGCKWG